MKKLQLSILGLMSAASLALYQALPDLMPTHWNVRGELDGVTPKPFGVIMMPLMTIFIYILFRVAPSFDPMKKRYEQFSREWEMIQTGFLAFMAYMQFITYYMAFYPKTNMMPLMFLGMGAFFMFLGNFLSKIRRNYFIGIRVPWTLASDENWNKTHRYASWSFVIAGLVTMIEGIIIWQAPIIILGSISLAAILPCIYSFLLFKKKTHFMKYVYVAIFGLMLILFGLRAVSGEDDWLCQNGTWVRHGSPSAQMPTKPCPAK